MDPVKTNAIALNASRRLASDLQAPLRQNAVTPLKTLLRMGALLFLGSEFGELHGINVKSATLSLFIACFLVSISLRNAKLEYRFLL
jgi:hypothetical protein